MTKLTLPAKVQDVFEEIVTLPFYQDKNFYYYASHLLVGEDSPSKYKEFISLQNHSDSQKPYLKLFKRAIKKLSAIKIPQEEYEQWLFNQTNNPTLNKYKNLVHQLYGELNLLSYTEYIEDNFPEVEEDTEYPESNLKYLRINPLSRSKRLSDLDSVTDKENNANYGQRTVLNRNNPFADVSIKDQTFLYASESGGFRTLELNTSYTLTRIQKDDLRSFLALQPGFKIRTSSRVDGSSESEISFDDTLTTEIAQDDDKVYIYLDAIHN